MFNALPQVVSRRKILVGGAGGALALLLPSPLRVMAKERGLPNDPFIVLLKGLYRPVPADDAPNDNLGLSDRTAIEFYNGGHTIHGRGTFDFLHRHLNWPKPEGAR